MWEHIKAYFKEGVGDAYFIDTICMVLGALGFIATVILSSVIATGDDYSDHKRYLVVLITTIFAGVTTSIDFRYSKKQITPFTIALGSIATFFSVGLWSRDVESDTKTALLIVQLCSNAIMMAVIFNQSRSILDNRLTYKAVAGR